MASSSTRAIPVPSTARQTTEPSAESLDLVNRKAHSGRQAISVTGLRSGKIAAQATSALKRKLDDLGDTTETENEATRSEHPPGKKHKVANATVKMAKTTTPRTKRATIAGSAGTKRGKKMPSRQQSTFAEPATLTAPINTALAAKVKLVKSFLACNFDTALERDPKHKNLVVVPSSLLAGAMRTMCAHYQIGCVDDARYSDVGEAFIDISKRLDGTDAVEVDYFTVDVTAETVLEKQVKEKIADYGLQDVRLLEVELEMIRKEWLERHSLPEKEHIEYLKEMSKLFGRPAGDVEDGGAEYDDVRRVDGTQAKEEGYQDGVASTPHGEVEVSRAGSENGTVKVSATAFAGEGGG